jgi:hypothetical protein
MIIIFFALDLLLLPLSFLVCMYIFRFLISPFLQLSAAFCFGFVPSFLPLLSSFIFFNISGVHLNLSSKLALKSRL